MHMEFIAELGEMFVSMYAELINRNAPEEKRGSKKRRVIAAIIAYTVVAVTVGLFVAAAVLFEMDKGQAGFILISVGIILSIAQILAAISFGGSSK